MIKYLSNIVSSLRVIFKLFYNWYFLSDQHYVLFSLVSLFEILYYLVGSLLRRRNPSSCTFIFNRYWPELPRCTFIFNRYWPELPRCTFIFNRYWPVLPGWEPPQDKESILLYLHLQQVLTCVTWVGASSGEGIHPPVPSSSTGTYLYYLAVPSSSTGTYWTASVVNYNHSIMWQMICCSCSIIFTLYH